MLAGQGDLILGLHSYTLHQFGFCGAWGGSELEPPVWDIFGLLDKTVELGLAGIQVTAVDLGLDRVLDEPSHLAAVKQAAGERGLWLEFNFSLNSTAYDIRMERSIDQGLDIAGGIGSQIAKITADIQRPRPLFGSRFHPEVMPQIEDLGQKLSAAADKAQSLGVFLAVENHQDLFAEELLWLLNRVDHPSVAACLDPTNALPLGEDPNRVVDQLAPVAVTNHLTDYGYAPRLWGFKFVGTVAGEGDIDLARTLQVIKNESPTRRIHLEVELDPGTDDLNLAREIEWRAAVESITNLRRIMSELT